MKKKMLFGLMIVFMLLIDVISPLTNLVFADNHSGNDLGNIFTLELFNVNGEPVVSGDLISIDNNTEVTLRYGWELINHQAMDGDFAQIIVPDAFKALASMSGDLNVNIEGSEDSINVGVYNLDKDTNVLRFVFNENIEELDVFDGFVQFNFEFDVNYFSENVRQLIPFEDSLGKEFQVVIIPSQISNAISKIGVPDSFLDANTITWTIDLMNTSEVSRLGYLKDVLDPGLNLDLDSFTLTPLVLGYHGDVSPIDSEKETIGSEEIELTEQGFNIDIPKMDAFAGYRLQYVTTFNDFNKFVFTNEATFVFDEDQEITAVSTVSGLSRSNIVEKSATVLVNNEIRWTIDVNKSNALIVDAIVQDILDDGLSLKADSIEITYLNLVSGSWQAGANYTSYSTSVDQQEITFNLGDIQTQAFRITYITTVEFLGDYKQSNTFVNNAILKDGNVIRGGDTTDATIVRAPILSKTSTSEVTYTNKTIAWTIRINEARHSLNNLMLTDTIPSGLILIADSIKVLDEFGVDVSDEFIIDTSALPVLSVNFGDIDTSTYTLNYRTEIVDFEKNTFVNNATLKGDGITGIVSVNATNSPPANTFAKSYRGIDYNEKTILWRLSVNPVREALSSLKITDTYPNKGLTLVEDSVIVSLDGSLLVKDEDYTIGFVTDSTHYKDGFIIEFTSKYNDTNPINANVQIDFKTSFDPALGIDENTNSNRVARNSAFFEATSINENVYNQTRSAQVTLNQEAWFNGKKQGRLVHQRDNQDDLSNGWVSGFERLIQWEVYTNYLEQNLNDTVVIADVLAYDGDFIESSIKIVEYDVNPNGTTAVTANVIGDDQYDVAVVDGQLTITFEEGYNQRLALFFLTTVPSQSLSVYTNNSSVTIGEGAPLIYVASINYQPFNQNLSKEELFDRPNQNAFVDEEIDWLITLNESLSIIKNGLIKDTISTGMVLIEDSVSVNAFVDGVEIEINPLFYDISISNNGITGDVATELSIQFIEDYEINTIIRITYKTVVVVDSGVISNSVSFSGDTVEEIVVETTELTARQLSFAGGVANTRMGSIVIQKSDSVNSDPLESTFELYYLINDEKRVVEDKTFDTVNGVYRFDNLSYRTYYLSEISAPDGYVILEEPIAIDLSSTTIDANREKIVPVNNIKTLVFEKTGSLADENTTYQKVGDVISYTLVARNTGEVILENVEIIDDKFSVLTDIRFYVIDSLGETIMDDVTNKDVTLAPTQALVMVAQYPVTQADIDGGVVENTAYVQATYRDDIAIKSVVDEVSVDALQDPSIEIIKHAVNGQNFSRVNDVIEYEFTVTNTGNVTLTNVIITDDLVNNLVYRTINGVPYVNGSITLAPDDVLVATATYSITQLDLDRGEVLNIASAIGQDPNGNDVEDDDRVDTDGVQQPDISLVKTVENESEFTRAGDTINYRFVVTNTGNVTLNSVKIIDDLVDTIDYISINGVSILDPLNIVLAPNDVLIATASYIVTQADMNRLEVSNQATVSAKAPNNDDVIDDDEAVIEGDSQPNISVVKEATIYNLDGIKLSENQTSFVESTQEWIVYEITATNTGNITLHNVSIVDQRLDLIDMIYIKIDLDGNEIEGVNNGMVTLQPNEKLVLRARLDVTQQMIDDDGILNVATATGYPENPNQPNTPIETTVDDEDDYTVEVNQISSLSLDKQLVNQGPFNQAGDLIEYRFIVENTGNTTLTNVRLVDAMVDQITYVSINGEQLADGNTPVTLQPNDVLFAIASYVITQQDVNAQAILNTAQVLGNTPNDSVIQDEDDVLLDGVYNPNISLKKAMVIYDGDDQIKTNQDAVEMISDWIVYEVVFANTGNITLHQVGIIDDKVGLYDIDFKILDVLGNVVDQQVINQEVTLQPGESLVMTAKLNITQEILDEGFIYNQAFGQAYPEDPNVPNEPSDVLLEENDELVIAVDQKIMISLEKTSIDIEYFDSINNRIYYLFTIINIGNTTLSEVMLLDDNIMEYTQFKLNGNDVTPLELGFTLESQDVLEIIGYAITQQQDIERGYIYNEAEVVGNDIFDESVSDQDSDTVTARKYHNVTLKKTNVIYNEDNEIVSQFASVSDVIVYTIKAVNTGNAIAYDVSIFDAMFEKMSDIVVTHLDKDDEVIGVYDYDSAISITLFPGEQILVVGNYQVTAVDITNQRILNQATVVFNDVNGDILGESNDNTLSYGLVDVLVKKVDSKDKTIVLSGAQFELRHVGSNQTWTIISNAEGMAIFSNLAFGEYELKEIVAPEGYVLSDELIVINIDEDSGDMIEIEFTNRALLPDTSDTRYHLAMLVLLLLGFVLIQISKEDVKNKKNKA